MYEETEIPGVYWMLDAEAYCWEDFHGAMIGAYSRIEDAAEGIEIVALEWISNINYPQTVKDAITLKTTKLQEAEAAKADEIRATAAANAQIAAAKGEAESIRLRAEALRNNPEIVQQIYAERSAGICPPGTQTCIVGSGAWPIVPQGNKNTY